MPTLETVVDQYLRSSNPAKRTRLGYSTTIKKWARWGGGLSHSEMSQADTI